MRDDVTYGHWCRGWRNRVPFLLAAGEIFRGQCPVAEPRPLHGPFTSSVGKLDGGHHLLRFHEIGDALQTGNLPI